MLGKSLFNLKKLLERVFIIVYLLFSIFYRFFEIKKTFGESFLKLKKFFPRFLKLKKLLERVFAPFFEIKKTFGESFCVGKPLFKICKNFFPKTPPGFTHKYIANLTLFMKQLMRWVPPINLVAFILKR